MELGQTALSNAIGNAISRSVVSNACRVAGQMSLLREVLGQLEEAGRESAEFSEFSVEGFTLVDGG